MMRSGSQRMIVRHCGIYRFSGAERNRAEPSEAEPSGAEPSGAERIITQPAVLLFIIIEILISQVWPDAVFDFCVYSRHRHLSPVVGV